MGLRERELARINAALAEKEADKRPLICGCGHALSRHEDFDGRWFCTGLKSTCPCREPWAAAKVPNARIFLYKSDETGHGFDKGVAKTLAGQFAHRLEYLDPKCTQCDQDDPEELIMVSLDSGRRNQLRCERHMEVE